MNKSEALLIFKKMRTFASGNRLRMLDEAIAYVDLYLDVICESKLDGNCIDNE